jgi:hypothetical protein
MLAPSSFGAVRDDEKQRRSLPRYLRM